MKTERTVLITGAAGGIGSVLVESFLRIDAKVIATDLKSEGLAALNAKLNAGARLVTATADLLVEDDCRRLAEFAQQTTGRVDILINCAGHFPLTQFEKISASEWRRIVDINLTGVFLTVQAVLPLMKANGWGRIISFGSGTFFKGSPNQAHYVAAKAGIIGLTRCLATELGVYGITCNVITPGLTLTGPVKANFPAEQVAARRHERPLQRDMHPEDLIGAVLFLASPASDFMTGQILNIDGGSVKH